MRHPQSRRKVRKGEENMMFYYCPGARKVTGQKATLADRIRMRKARKIRERMWRVF